MLLLSLTLDSSCSCLLDRLVLLLVLVRLFWLSDPLQRVCN